MKRTGMIWILCVLVHLVWSQADPLFLMNKTPMSIFWSMDGTPWSNPSYFKPGISDTWHVAVTNHSGIRSFNTVHAGGHRAVSEQLVILANFQHNSPGHDHFSRTRINLGSGILLNKQMALGISLNTLILRLPEPLGVSALAGGVTGLSVQISDRMDLAMAGGYYRKIKESRGFSGESYTLLAATWFLQQGKNSRFFISTEAVQGSQPWIAAGFKSHIASGFELMAGFSNGTEQLFAGVSFSPGKYTCGSISGVHPLAGLTQSFWVSKKYRQP